MSAFGPMGAAKPFASLSSGLLARKGGARPAMRRQLLGGAYDPADPQHHDDLGWNDMGHDTPHAPQPHAGLTPMSGHEAPVAHAPAEEPVEEIVASEEIAATDDSAVPEDAAAPEEIVALAPEDSAPEHGAAETPVPAVIEERAALARAVVTARKTGADKPAIKPEAAKSLAAARAAKAAFTLRLDPERHLRLRLACAVTNRSAQQIVTEALDTLLSRLPDVDSLAEQIPHAAGRKQVG